MFVKLKSLIKSLTAKLLIGMNHDFCPQLNQYVYWLKQPIGWVVSGAFFSMLFGLLIGSNGFVLMWSFIALLIMGVAWPWLSMKGISCQLQFEESRGHENEPTKVILKITNRMPLPVFGLMVSGHFLQDVLSEDDQIAVALKRVPAWSVSQFDWMIEPRRRGKLPTETPTISTGFPFGLYCIEKPVEMLGETIVWPACHELSGGPDLDGSQFNVEGSANQKAGSDGETIGVREYRYGDSVRNIHWNHTARYNRLIVREKQSLTQTPIRIVVDLTPNHHSGVGSRSTFEWAIRVAASVCRQLHQHQARIELVCVGLPPGIPDRISNRLGLPPMLDFLALLPQFGPDLVALANDDSIQHHASAGHFTIFIHTRSCFNSPTSSQIKHLWIDPKGFDRKESTGSCEDGPVRKSADESSGVMAITDPDSASAQLSQLWHGNFNAAS